MAHIDITRSHTLPKDKVQSLVVTVADDLVNRFGGSYELTPTGTRFKAPGVDGTFDILDNAIRVTVTLGLLMRPLKSVLEKQIHDEIDKLSATYESPTAGKKKTNGA